MSVRPAQAVGLALLVLLTPVAAACGVPQDDEPRALSAAEVPFASAAASAAPADDGNRQVELWFVRDGRVVPTARRVDGPTSVPALGELLFGGTSEEERNDGLISVVPSTLSLEEVQVQNGTAVLTLDGPDAEVLRTQPLAYAQIVATLTSVGSVDGVRFRLDGRDLRVPRGDGSLSDGPVTRNDYAELLAAPEAASADAAAADAAAADAPAPPAPAPPAPPAAATPAPTPSA